MSEMTSTFKSKAKQFVDDIITDVNIKKLPKDTTPMLKDDPSANIITPNGDSSPQAYREESRVSEFGKQKLFCFISKLFYCSNTEHVCLFLNTDSFICCPSYKCKNFVSLYLNLNFKSRITLHTIN